MSDINTLIDNVSEKDFAAAGNVFSALVAEKVRDALDAERVKIAAEIYDNEINEIDEDV